MTLRTLLPVSVCTPATSEPSSSPSVDSTLDFVSSDATLDRYSEIISPAGWHLETYRRNPVFQNAHQYGDIIFTLGRALVTEVREVAGRQALFQRIQFATEANPMARIAFALYKGNFLNAVSVGLIPLRWEDPVGQATSPAGSGGVPPRPHRIYLEQELIEVSAVAIPANPNALALAAKSGAVEKSDLKETLALLSQAISTPPAAPSRSPSPGGEGRGEGGPSSTPSSSGRSPSPGGEGRGEGGPSSTPSSSGRSPSPGGEGRGEGGPSSTPSSSGRSPSPGGEGRGEGGPSSTPSSSGRSPSPGGEGRGEGGPSSTPSSSGRSPSPGGEGWGEGGLPSPDSQLQFGHLLPLARQLRDLLRHL